MFRRKVHAFGNERNNTFERRSPDTEPLQKSNGESRFFSRVGRYAATILLGASLLFGSCKEDEKPTTSIYFKEPAKYVLYQKDSNHSNVWVADNQILLTFKEDASSEDKQSVQDYLTTRGATQVGFIEGMESYQYELKEGDNITTVLTALEQMGAVWVVGPNIKIDPQLNPNPNLAIDVTWGHWWIDTIKARGAWDITTGSENISIGVVDNGSIYYKNGHFDGKTIKYAKSCSLIVTDQTTGKTEVKTHFYQYDEEIPVNCTITQVTGDHGNQVALYATARGDDGKGGAGVAWKNTLVYVPTAKLLAELEGALKIAIKMGAKVVNLSLGPCYGSAGGVTEQCDHSVKRRPEDYEYFRNLILPAIKEAYESNVLVTIAAGNDGLKKDDNWLPSSISTTEVNYFRSNVITVGATDDWNNPACDSIYPILTVTRLWEPCKCPQGLQFPDKMTVTYGSDMTVEGKVVELSAPGYMLAEAKSDGKFNEPIPGLIKLNQNGTSLSAPMVAGAAGLVWAVNPNLKAYEVKEILLQSAQKGLSKCHDIGYGILNVEAAVKRAKDYPTTATKSGIITFGGTKKDFGDDIIQTANGDYVIYGNMNGKSTLLGITSSLSKSWETTLTAGEDTLTCSDIPVSSLSKIHLANDGGYALLSKPPAYYFTKTDSKGNPLWKWDPQLNYVFDLKVIGGEYYAGVNGSIWGIYRIDNSGKSISSKTFHADGQDVPIKFTYTSDAGVAFLFGLEFSSTVGILKTVEAQTTGFGDYKKEWKETYVNGNYTYSFQQTKDGGFVIAALGNGLMKVNSLGKLSWTTNMSSSTELSAAVYSVIEMQDGGYTVAGYSKRLAALAKISSTGTLLWEKTFLPSGYFSSKINSAKSINDGFILTGQAVKTEPKVASETDCDILVVKTDKDGNVK